MKEKVGYLHHVKQLNMSKVLHSIWSSEPVPRIKLVDQTELTSGTITNLTQELLKAGLIKEFKSFSNMVGRRPIMLRIAVENYRLIGIDIGRNSIEVVLTNLSGKIMMSRKNELLNQNDPKQVLKKIVVYVNEMIQFSHKSHNFILGIGLSIPGPMDLKQGKLLSPPNFQGWTHFPIQKELEQRLFRAIKINDDARSSALAERWFGLGRKGEDFVYITMGVGIGGGVVANGELLYGKNGLYGQIGHMSIIPDGILCACGNIGCWETVGSIPGILKRWKMGAEENHTIDDFFKAVSQGDMQANRCLESTLQMLESVLITLYNVYDPDLIVLGGTLSTYLKSFIPRIRRNVQSRMYSFAKNRLMIEHASFGESQSAVGAAAIVFGHLLHQPLDVIELIEVKESNDFYLKG